MPQALQILGKPAMDVLDVLGADLLASTYSSCFETRALPILDATHVTADSGQGMGVWGYGGMGVWGYGGMEYGDMGVWGYGGMGGARY